MKGARVAPVMRIRSVGEMGKMWRGVPAAAQTTGKSVRRGSAQIGRGVR